MLRFHLKQRSAYGSLLCQDPIGAHGRVICLRRWRHTVSQAAVPRACAACVRRCNGDLSLQDDQDGGAAEGSGGDQGTADPHHGVIAEDDAPVSIKGAYSNLPQLFLVAL